MPYTNFPISNSSKIIAYFYTTWVAFWFVLIFLLLFPLYWLFLQKESWKRNAHYLNRIWGKVLFVLIGMKVEVKYEYKPEKEGTYIFVSNHFSYWDIACMGTIIDNYFAFVGKTIFSFPKPQLMPKEEIIFFCVPKSVVP